MDAMRENCWRVLDAAYARGIRWFDTARSYGEAEAFLSGWLQARGLHGKVTVSSKWGYTYTANFQVDTGGAPHEVKEHSVSNLRAQTAQTLALLGPSLALYQIHSATLESGVLRAADVLQELERIKMTHGVCIGLSVTGTQQAVVLREALQVRMSGGRPLFDSVQATWNLLEQSAGEALLEAHTSGMRVIVKEGMANGRLTQRNSSSACAQQLLVLQRVAEKYGVGTDAVALAVVMLQPFQPLVLSGASNAAQLGSNAEAVALTDLLEASDVAELCSTLRQPPAEYWQDRGKLAWC
ncbi:MAG: hypothetical protein WDW38_000794 [Sanguina aurantia]